MVAAPRHEVLIQAHSTAADTLLVIEVADGSLPTNLATTLRLDQ